jgi:hypothetical protein
LVRATLHGGGPAFDRDQVGTSFAAPKVTRLAAKLQQLLPDQPCLLYRALIANGARWPKWAEEQASEIVLGRIGYGIPQPDKALTGKLMYIKFRFHQSFGRPSSRTGFGSMSPYLTPRSRDEREGP